MDPNSKMAASVIPTNRRKRRTTRSSAAGQTTRLLPALPQFYSEGRSDESIIEILQQSVSGLNRRLPHDSVGLRIAAARMFTFVNLILSAFSCNSAGFGPVKVLFAYCNIFNDGSRTRLQQQEPGAYCSP